MLKNFILDFLGDTIFGNNYIEILVKLTKLSIRL